MGLGLALFVVVVVILAYRGVVCMTNRYFSTFAAQIFEMICLTRVSRDIGKIISAVLPVVGNYTAANSDQQVNHKGFGGMCISRWPKRQVVITCICN